MESQSVAADIQDAAEDGGRQAELIRSQSRDNTDRASIERAEESSRTIEIIPPNLGVNVHDVMSGNHQEPFSIRVRD